MLIGVSTITGAFSPEVLSEMAVINERPIVFPLSNPTSKSECTFVEAYRYTNGNVVFASGSPFPPYTTNDERTLFPAQANNAYISFLSVLVCCWPLDSFSVCVPLLMRAGRVSYQSCYQWFFFLSFMCCSLTALCTYSHQLVWQPC